MAHYVVGDGHFVNEPDQVERWQALLRLAAERGLTRLTILGDFFELWVARPSRVDPWREAFLQPLRELRRTGVRVDYVEGNKDYFIGPWNARHHAFDSVFPVSTCGEGYRFAHGDLVNREDRQYRTWRWFSRSLPIRVTLNALPYSWLQSLSNRVGQRLQQTNVAHKSYFPTHALTHALREEPDPKVRGHIYGHFHVCRRVAADGRCAWTLPFLGATFDGFWLDGNEVVRWGLTTTDPRPAVDVQDL